MAGFHYENNVEVKAQKKELALSTTVPYYLEKFEAILKENGGFFVGGKVISLKILLNCIFNLIILYTRWPGLISGLLVWSTISTTWLELTFWLPVLDLKLWRKRLRRFLLSRSTWKLALLFGSKLCAPKSENMIYALFYFVLLNGQLD